MKSFSFMAARRKGRRAHKEVREKGRRAHKEVRKELSELQRPAF